MTNLRRRDVLLAGLGCLCSGCMMRNFRSPINTTGIQYRVRPGDSLTSIANRHGIPTIDVIRFNNLGTRGVVPGEVLFLPGAQVPVDTLDPSTALLDYQFVRRQDWGAERPGPNHDAMGGIGALTLHHTCEYEGMRQDSDLQAVQTIAGIHRNKLGWADIGYHYLVGRDGRVYEGRPLNIQGAHCGGPNNQHNIGVSLIGDFSKRAPDGHQERAAMALLKDLQRRYRIGSRFIYAHRDFNGQYTATACPGDAGYAWLHRFKSIT